MPSMCVDLNVSVLGSILGSVAGFVIQAFEASHHYLLLGFSSESVQERDG